MFLVDAVNEPILDFDLPCGTLYETVYDLREGMRWYLDGSVIAPGGVELRTRMEA